MTMNSDHHDRWIVEGGVRARLLFLLILATAITPLVLLLLFW